MAVANLKYITEDEYLALEEKAGAKHEYYNGQIFPMAGASPVHARVTARVIHLLEAAVAGKGCNTYSSDLRIRVLATGLNTYPDATVVCGELRLTDTKPQAAINPTVLVEVLSDSTESYDRGEKWRHYQTFGSLMDYVLVRQDRPCIEVYSRQPSGGWEYRLSEDWEAAAELHGVSAHLVLH